MFQSIRKFTPLLKRSFICLLTLILLFGCFCMPLTVNAYLAFDPASAALWAWLQASGFLTDSAEAGATVLGELISSISEYASQGVPSFMALMKVMNNVSGNARVSLTDEDRAALSYVIFNNFIVRSLLKHPSVDLTDDNLTQEQIPIISAGVQMYIPTEAAMQDIMSITQMQVLYEGFIDQQINISLETNSILLGLQRSLKTTLLNINSSIGKMKNSLKTTLLQINKSVDEMHASLKTTLLNVEESLNTIQTSFKTTLLRINDNISDTRIALRYEFFPPIQQTLDDILEKIPVYKEIEILQKPQIEVQVGQQQILVQDYATMSHAFSAKLGWVSQIFDFLSSLRSRLNSGTPPKIPIRLSAAEGSIDWGDDTYILDMSWYARYKPSVDTILSGIMWLCFGWAIYKRIPDILSGVGITVENATQDAGHVWSDRAEKAASLSYRQERRAEYYNRKSRGG